MEVDTSARADVLAGDTLLVTAFLTGAAGVSTIPAVRGVGFDVDALSHTDFVLAGALASSLGAGLSRAAAIVALTAVEEAAAYLNAAVFTSGFARVAGRLAFAFGAHLVFTACVTATAVVAIGFEINALASAQGEAGRTRGLTLALKADLRAAANIAAEATVLFVALGINAGSTAVGLWGGASEKTGSLDTYSTVLAGIVTKSTVFFVALEVDTRAAA